jgi:hypothetical protein
MWPSGPDPPQLISGIVLYSDHPRLFIAQVSTAVAIAFPYTSTGIHGGAFVISGHNLIL